MPPDANRHDPDVALLERIAAGDQRAFGALVDRHGRGLRIFATRYLGNAEDGSDVTQDVFMTVWRRAASYDPAKGKVSTWLYGIASNRCIDVRRKRAVLSFFGLDDRSDAVSADEPDAEARTTGRQELAIVRSAIQTLPGRQKMALLLSVVADLDSTEIAAAMGTSRGSVEQLLVRARRTLRQQVGGRTERQEAQHG